MDNCIKMSRYDTLPRLCGSVIKFPKYKTIHRQMDSHSRRQIIEHHDFMTERQKLTDKMRANESRTTSNQNLHQKSPNILIRQNAATKKLSILL